MKYTLMWRHCNVYDAVVYALFENAYRSYRSATQTLLHFSLLGLGHGNLAVLWKRLYWRNCNNFVVVLYTVLLRFIFVIHYFEIIFVGLHFSITKWGVDKYHTMLPNSEFLKKLIDKMYWISCRFFTWPCFRLRVTMTTYFPSVFFSTPCTVPQPAPNKMIASRHAMGQFKLPRIPQNK